MTQPMSGRATVHTSRDTGHRIVVLGAGYAGLGAAKRLARGVRSTDVRLTLVDRGERFVERVRLHQLASGQDLEARPLSEVLAGTGVELVVATVTGIDLDGQTVHLDTAPHALPYDVLVYALGSGADLGAVPGVREHAFSLADARSALQLREHLADVAPGGPVVVAGGGLTGIEAAAELAEARADLRIHLVSASPLGGWLSEPARRHLRRALDRLGVTVHAPRRITAVGPDAVLLDDGQELAVAAVIWAAGFAVPRLAADAGLAVDARSRMVVDDHLRSVSHPQVYGIGDAAAAPTPGGTEARMSCQTGLPMGQYLARQVAGTLNGRRPKPIRIRYVWQNISLGRRDGVTQFTRTDDSPLPLLLTGRASAWFKEAVTRGAAWTVTR
jgi:NADH:quinone reductase (non-electrogenic)